MKLLRVGAEGLERPALLIAFLSRFMSLNLGGVISAETLPRVGLRQKPPVHLNPGDKIRLGIGGFGERKQRVVAARTGD